MNNEQVLEILEHNWTKLVNPDYTDEELGQALDLVLKAFEETEQGEWITIREEQGALGIIYKRRKCNRCGWETSLLIPRNFCPNCGIKMKGGKE